MISRNIWFVQRLWGRRHGLRRAGVVTVTRSATSGSGLVRQILQQVAGLDAVVDARVGGRQRHRQIALHVLARVPGARQPLARHGARRHQMVGGVLRVVRVTGNCRNDRSKYLT